MRIGIDFDNTIVRYDLLFHSIAMEQRLVPPDMPADKVAIRDYLRLAGHEDRWTEMQGLVYGARMSDAQAYVGAVECLCLAKKRRYDVSVVSHRTRHPFLGVPIDLHNAARSWITSHLMCDGELLIPEASVFFEVTKDAKLARIEALRCDVFIDDLPEILCADRFPASTARVLFDPDSHHASSACEGLQVYRTWQEIAAHLCQ